MLWPMENYYSASVVLNGQREHCLFVTSCEMSTIE